MLATLAAGLLAVLAAGLLAVLAAGLAAALATGLAATLVAGFAADLAGAFLATGALTTVALRALLLTVAFLAAGAASGAFATLRGLRGAASRAEAACTASFGAAGFGATFFAATFFAVSASFFICALDGKASATPFLAALERLSVVAAGAASFFAGVAWAGLAAPSFRRTGFSPQSSSRW